MLPYLEKKKKINLRVASTPSPGPDVSNHRCPCDKETRQWTLSQGPSSDVYLLWGMKQVMWVLCAGPSLTDKRSVLSRGGVLPNPLTPVPSPILRGLGTCTQHGVWHSKHPTEICRKHEWAERWELVEESSELTDHAQSSGPHTWQVSSKWWQLFLPWSLPFMSSMFLKSGQVICTLNGVVFLPLTRPSKK